MAKVIIIENCEFSKEEFIESLNYISEERKKYIIKFHRYMDQCRGLASSLLTRCMIHEYTKLDNPNIIFGKGEYGKPYCLSVPNIKYNLSHSGNYVVGIFDDNEVGIDIEVYEKEENDEIVKRFFCKEEIETYIASKDKQRSFYELWTIKEAYVKYIGKGMSKGFDTFCISNFGGKTIITDYEIDKNKDIYVEIKRNENYCLSTISSSNILLEEWTLESLLDRVRKLNPIMV